MLQKEQFFSPWGDLYTPWGRADGIVIISDGIAIANTPSHGGVWVSNERINEIPEYMRIPSGYSFQVSHGVWFEEDNDSLIPEIVFYEEFDAYHLKLGLVFNKENRIKALCNSFPLIYEKYFSVKLKTGESFKKDEAEFELIYKDYYRLRTCYSISNLDIKVPEDFVVVIADVIGVKNSSKKFLVPKDKFGKEPMLKKHGLFSSMAFLEGDFKAFLN